MLEINLDTPTNDVVLDELMFNPRFHNTDQLIASLTSGQIPYYQLNELASDIQNSIQATPKLHAYALSLWKATHNPQQFGIKLEDVDMQQLLLSGASPRGMSYWIRAAKVRAWLENRDHVLPEDMQNTFAHCIGHRLFLNPMYAYRKEQLIPNLLAGILTQVAAP